jgi:predicted nucleotidyltransferase
MEKHFSEQLEKAIEYLSVKYSPYAIYLFGSAARDELRSESDIDIAFLSINQVNAVDCYESSQDLYEILRRDVDLINLATASTVFSMQVIANSRLVFCNDDMSRMRYEMVVYKSYAMLNEERSEILNMAGERGYLSA